MVKFSTAISPSAKAVMLLIIVHLFDVVAI
jgi:hypothetical protein